MNLTIFLLLISVILVIVGLLAISSYFYIHSSGVFVGMDLYQLDNPEKTYTGKEAQIRALRSLFVGAFFVTVGGGFLVALLLILVLR